MSEPGSRIDLDVAFGRAELASVTAGRVALDRQGRRVAYQVRTPPEQSPEGDPRFLPSGVPVSVVGQAVHYADVGGGDGRSAVQAGPPGATSWHPSWSPDGQSLAFYSDAHGYPELWVHDVRAGTSRPVSDVRIKAKLWLGDEPQWLPEGSAVIVPLAPPAELEEPPEPRPDGPTVRVLRSRDLVNETGSVSELNEHAMRENNASIAAVNLADGTVRVLAPADATPPPSVAQVSPSGGWVAYLSVHQEDDNPDGPSSKAFHDLIVVPTAGGERTTVARHVAMSAIPTGYYLDTYVWHPTRDQLFWIDQGLLWTVELGEQPGEPRRVAPCLDGLSVTPLLLTRAGNALVVGVESSEPAGVDSDPPARQLAVVPLDGEPHTVIALPDGLAEPRVVSQRNAVAWEPREPREGAIAVLVRQPSTTERVLLSVDLKTGAATRLWHGLARLEPAGAAPDHGFLVAAYEDFRHPGDLWCVDGDGHRYRRLTTIEPRLENLELGTVETFQTRVPQHDGTYAGASTAVLLPAGKRRGDRLPAIMFCYPGGRVSHCAAEWGGGMPSTLPLTPFLDRGYAILLAEAPIGPPGKPGNPRAELAAVLVPQLYRAAQLGYVDLERVALAGHSYGGYGTAATISATNAFAAAVAIQGMYDLAGQYAWLGGAGMLTSRFWYFETGQGRMGVPLWEAPQRYYANSPYHRADRIQTPLLLIHGASDTVYPVADASQLYNALKRLGQDVELAIYDGEGHVPFEWSRANAVDALRRTLDFLDRHLS